MCRLPLLSGGACFCTRDAMESYDVVLLIVALVKTVAPAGSPRQERGRPAGFCPSAFLLSRADKAPTGFGVSVRRIGAQKPAEANDIYRPVRQRYFMTVTIFN